MFRLWCNWYLKYSNYLICYDYFGAILKWRNTSVTDKNYELEESISFFSRYTISKLSTFCYHSAWIWISPFSRRLRVRIADIFRIRGSFDECWRRSNQSRREVAIAGAYCTYSETVCLRLKFELFIFSPKLTIEMLWTVAFAKNQRSSKTGTFPLLAM